MAGILKISRGVPKSGQRNTSILGVVFDKRYYQKVLAF